MMFNQPQALLKLLQLVSPVLPVGAYSYSEGLETLTQTGQVTNAPTLEHWLLQELRYGAIAVEAAMLVQAYRHLKSQDSQSLNSANAWLSAFRETEELRLQSWQMGRSLTRLLSDLDASIALRLETIETPLNFALVFAIAAAHWQIPLEPALMGYLHSWAANLVNAGVRLIPLGQTQGQQVLLHLYPDIEATTARVLSQTQDELETCGWGLAIASMNHQTLYSRLFRS